VAFRMALEVEATVAAVRFRDVTSALSEVATANIYDLATEPNDGHGKEGGLQHSGGHKRDGMPDDHNQTGDDDDWEH
jgi:hypothetical protein